MYFLIVLLFMLVLPVGSIYLEHSYLHSATPLMLLIGKWFVFWSAGVRLFLAGLRQFFQPRFTAEEIFGIKSDDALPFVRELGAANFATGVPKLRTCWMSDGFSTASPRHRCHPTSSMGRPLLTTMRAASGSHQMLYSAAGVTLPSQQGAPPMTTQRLTFAAMPGILCKARATFVSGPSVTSTTPE